MTAPLTKQVAFARVRALSEALREAKRQLVLAQDECATLSVGAGTMHLVSRRVDKLRSGVEQAGNEVDLVAADMLARAKAAK